MNLPDPAAVIGGALALGAVYALLGVAVSIVVLAARTLHLAIGEILVLGVLVGLVLGVEAVVGVPAIVAVLVAVALGAVVSAALVPVLLDRLPPGLAWLVGLAVAGGVIQAVSVRYLGTRTVRPPAPLDLPGVSVAGVAVDGAVVAALVAGIPAALLLAAAVDHTRWGRRVRIVGASAVAARRAGISPARVRAGALAVSGASAVLAGMLLAPVAFVGAGQGAGFTVRAVAAAVLFGAGGPRRAVAGGLVLGAVESVASGVWPAAGGELAVAALVVGMLALRGPATRQAWGRPW